MRIRYLITVFIVSSSIFSGSFSGSAEEKIWNRHKGFFLEAGVGTNAFYAFMPTGSYAAMVGWGIPVAIGYNFFKNVAIEAGFIYSSELNENANITITNLHLSGSEAAKLYIPYLVFRFGVPIKDRLSIIFKLGGMYPYSQIDLKGSASWGGGGISKTGRISGNVPLPFAGIGLAYAVSRKLEINLMYQGAVYILVSGAVLSLGMTYHF